MPNAIQSKTTITDEMLKWWSSHKKLDEARKEKERIQKDAKLAEKRKQNFLKKEKELKEYARLKKKYANQAVSPMGVKLDRVLERLKNGQRH